MTLIFAALLFSLHTAKADSLAPPDAANHYERAELIKWEDKGGNEPLSELRREKISAPKCAGDKYLYPTNPSQTTKHYHVIMHGRYDVSKLKSDDELCKNGNHVASNPAGRVCFYAATPDYLVMSDFFTDRCGNVVRGVWRQYFTFKEKVDDHYYHLSKGRVVNMIDREGYRDAENDNTYPVEPKEFIEFYAVNAEDLKKIEEDRTRSLKDGGYVFDEKSFLFLKKN